MSVWLLVGVIAGISFYLNRCFWRLVGARAIITWGPLTEEVLKSGTALCAGVPLLPVHVGFGIVEAAYDWYAGGCRQAVVLSLMAHSLFGAVTVFIAAASHNNWLAIATAIALHAAWNLILVKQLYHL